MQPVKPHAGAYERFPDGPDAFRKESADAALKQLFQAAVAHAQNRIDWYNEKAEEKGRVARRQRRLSLLLFAVGTLAPILLTLLSKFAQALANSTSQSAILDLIAGLPLAEFGFVALGIAGALVIFDQFFDTSGSWMRFRQAQARIEVLLADLRFTWAELLIQSDGAPADGKAATASVALLREFVVKVEQLTETETKEWAERFRSRIDAFDSNPNLNVRLESRDRRSHLATPLAGAEGKRGPVEVMAGLDPDSIRFAADGAGGDSATPRAPRP
jgi:hypothetical protein